MIPSETINLQKIRRKVVVQIEDENGQPLLELTFFWLPAAITKRTLPNFIALDDEPLAQAQREALEALLERRATVEALQGNRPSKDPGTVSRESLEAEIKARRDKALGVAEVKTLIAAKRLLVLLDPDQPSDITENGEPLPADPEAFASVLTSELMEGVRGSIIEAMQKFLWKETELK